MATEKHRQAIDRSEAAFQRWLKDNPGGRFSDYYVAMVTKQLDAGRPHATLGRKLKDTEDWRKSGTGVLRKLIAHGLEKHHVCVDYGCGSLRLGQHIMAHLEPGNYWGFDVTDRFMQDGIAVLGNEFISTHKPNLHVIAADALAQAARAQPDFIISMAVLIHVPPDELSLFVDQFMSVVVAKTSAFMTYKASDSLVRYSGRSWAYPESTLVEEFAARGAGIEFLDAAEYHDEDAEAVLRRGWMKITRRA